MKKKKGYQLLRHYLSMPVAVALVSALLGNLIGYLPVYLPLYFYPLIVAIGMASYLGINFLQLRRINQIPLAAALKNRE